jgi:hypothetical protein
MEPSGREEPLSGAKNGHIGRDDVAFTATSCAECHTEPGDFGVAVVCWLIRSPPDERDGHGRLDRARVVRALRRHVGRDDGGDDAAWRSASRPAVRRRQRSRRRVAPLSGLVPRRLGTVRARRLRPLPAARRVCRGRSNNRGLRLRAHAAEARVPASLPRQRPFFRFGMFCVGSSVGLMLVLVALEPMSVIWVAVVGGIVLAQKLPAAASRHRRAVGPRIVGSESQLSSDDGKERSR